MQDSSAQCSECKRLERDYQNTVTKIAFVVAKRSMRLSEKIQEVSKWQDARDEALEAFYEHKKCHPRKKAA